MIGASRWGDHHQRLLTRLLLGLMALLGVLAISDVAHAQDDVSIQVQVKNQQRDATGRPDNQPYHPADPRLRPEVLRPGRHLRPR